MGRAKDEGAEQLFVIVRFSKQKCLKLCFKNIDGRWKFDVFRPAVGPATENERSPNLVDRSGSTSWWWAAERSEDRPGKVATRTQKSAWTESELKLCIFVAKVEEIGKTIPLPV